MSGGSENRINKACLAVPQEQGCRTGGPHTYRFRPALMASLSCSRVGQGARGQLVGAAARASRGVLHTMRPPHPCSSLQAEDWAACSALRNASGWLCCK